MESSGAGGRRGQGNTGEPSAMRPEGGLPPHILDKHKHVNCAIDAPTYTSTPEYAGVYASLGVDNSLDLDELRREMRIEVQSMSADEMVFDIIGIDAPIANALRRILLVEVPTMAIEKVWIMENNSIIQDEVRGCLWLARLASGL